MTITILSSREFNQDASRAKKAASKGPVFITDRGKPNYVRRIEELTDDELAMISEARVSAEHDHLNALLDE